jgi:hypothetical protein
MFTWEEAGQLRSMLQVLKWGLIAIVLGLIAFEHEPLGVALSAGVQLIAGHHAAPAAPPDARDAR